METKVSAAFKETIQSYLDAMAGRDAAFAESYANENKSVDECCEYILGQVYSRGENGYTDAEIFGMAVHYYVEKDLGEWPKADDVTAVVNHHVELTPEEIEEAKKEAQERITREEVEKIRQKERKAQEAAKKKAEEAKEKAKANGEVSLFEDMSLFEE